MSTPPRSRSAVDGPTARLAAVLVILLCISALAYLHRETLFPTAEPAADAANPQLAACLEERVGAVDQMRAEGVIDTGRYADFRARAEAFCRQQFGDSGP